MRTISIIAFTTGLVLINTAHAQTGSARNPSVEVALSEDTLQARYRADTSLISQKNAEISYAIFLSEDRDVVGSATLLAGTDVDFGPLQIRLGPQAYAALLSQQNNDVFALAVGVEARYNLLRSGAMALVGSAFYSPDVLTFGAADNIKDYMARGEMSLGSRLMGFAGYRWFTIDQLRREDETLQKEVFVGVRWQLH